MREQLSDLYLGARWMRDGDPLLQRRSRAARCERRPETYDAGRAGAATAPSRAAAAIGLAQHAHFAAANYARGAAVGGARPARSPRRSAASPASHRARGAAAGGARRRSASRITFGALCATCVEEGIAQRRQCAARIVHPSVEAFLAVGELERAERLARIADERAAGRLRAAVVPGRRSATCATRLGPAHWAEAERSWSRAPVGLARSHRRRARPQRWRLLGARPPRPGAGQRERAAPPARRAARRELLAATLGLRPLSAPRRRDCADRAACVHARRSPASVRARRDAVAAASAQGCWSSATTDAWRQLRRTCAICSMRVAQERRHRQRQHLGGAALGDREGAGGVAERAEALLQVQRPRVVDRRCRRRARRAPRAARRGPAARTAYW